MEKKDNEDLWKCGYNTALGLIERSIENYCYSCWKHNKRISKIEILDMIRKIKK